MRRQESVEVVHKVSREDMLVVDIFNMDLEVLSKPFLVFCDSWAFFRFSGGGGVIGAARRG